MCGAVPEVLGQRPLLGGPDPSGLAVEDGYDVRAYSVEVLRELGYPVLEAHDRLSALRLPEWQTARVDLLFSDVVLASGMIGPQLVDAARASSTAEGAVHDGLRAQRPCASWRAGGRG